MNNKIVGNVELENSIISIIEKLLQNIAIYKAMYSLLSYYKENYVFINLLNNTAMMTIIRFSNIFGTDSEENHWKKLFKGDENSFRKNVILKVFKNMDEYRKYYDNLINFRSNYTVHYLVGNAKYLDKKENYLIELPDLTQGKELLIKTLLYLLSYFNYSNTENADKEINDFYEDQYLKTIKMFSNMIE